MSTLPAPSHQTVCLGRGPHVEPSDEVCVVELASMLAGEPFSDHPSAVCPVIAAFLRTYNDRLDDRRRQDLYPTASLVVGSRRGPRWEAERGNMCCARFLQGHDSGRGLRRLLARRAPSAWRPEEAAAAAARRVEVSDEGHRRALAFVEELLEAGDAPARPSAGGLLNAPETPRRAAPLDKEIDEEVTHV